MVPSARHRTPFPASEALFGPDDELLASCAGTAAKAQ